MVAASGRPAPIAMTLPWGVTRTTCAATSIAVNASDEAAAGSRNAVTAAAIGWPAATSTRAGFPPTTET